MNALRIHEELLKKAEKDLKKFVNSNFRIMNFAPPFIMREAERLADRVEELKKLIAKEKEVKNG